MADTQLSEQASDGAWGIAPGEFPDNGSSRDVLAFLVRYAVLAPSGHNTQPWRFVLSDKHVDVVADMSRALHTVDPHDRELTISCAAAAQTMFAALEAFGLSGEVTPLPIPQVSQVIARVTLDDRPASGTIDYEMLEAIANRRTVRRAYAETPVPPAVQRLLRETAAPFGVELGLFEGGATRDAIAELVIDADHIQFADPAFRSELASWMHPLASPAGDGLAGPGLGFPDWATRVAANLFRAFNLGSAVARMDKPNVLGAPLLGSFSTPGDTKAEWVATGRALAAVLHVLTMQGIVSAYLNQPIEVTSIRPKIAELTAPGLTPQLLSRFGYLKEGIALPPHAARRSVDEVLIAA
ncbi:MAG: hypothetical protein WC829_02540 [Hyphomicrobium sp.]|jgi:hypothetical protein